MASLPVVKPADYEDFLQGYLNDHPSIGHAKLLKALEQTMHVTSSARAIRTWLSHHEPIIQLEDHEDFLLEQLAKEPLIGRKAMCTALREARGVTVKEAPIRAWLAAHQPMPFAEAAASSSGPSMALLQMSDLGEYEEFLQQELS